MPKIPTYQAEAVVRPTQMSPGAAAAPYTELARTGQDVEGTGLYAQRVFSTIQEAERRVKASEIENLIKSNLDDALVDLKMRTDFENFDQWADQVAEDTRGKYADMVGDDKRLQEAVNVAAQDLFRDFNRTVQARKIEEITNRGRGQLSQMAITLQDDYAAAQSPEERQEIVNRYTAQANAFAESGIVSYTEAVNSIEAFANSAESVRADRYIDADPHAALTVLKEGGFDLDPKTKQDKIEKAAALVEQLERQRISDAEKAEAEARRLVKERQDRNADEMWSQAFQGQLRVRDIIDGLDKGDIRHEDAKQLENYITSPESFHNDPDAVGDIAEMVALGQLEDAREFLEVGKRHRNVKPNTYINYRKAIAQEGVDRGMTLINMAYRPSENDMDTGRRAKYADAVDLYLTRISEGENPLEVARELIHRGQIQTFQTMSSLVKPRFLEDERASNYDPISDQALEKAKQTTMDKWETGVLGDDQLAKELELIQQWKELNARSKQQSTGAIDDELKKRGVK